MNLEQMDYSICPYCQKDVGSHFDIHEVLVHPEKRARFYTTEYVAWKEEQDKKLSKKKKKS